MYSVPLARTLHPRTPRIMPHRTQDSPHSRPPEQITLWKRGTYILPILCATENRPMVLIVDRHGRLLHQMVMEPGESDEAAYARGEGFLSLLDPD